MATSWMTWGLLAAIGGPVATAAPSTEPAPAESLDEATRTLVGRIQRKYAPVETLKASFVQITSGVYAEESRGEIWLRRPNLMRWDFAGSGKRYVFDGTTFWISLPEHKQVQKSTSVVAQSMVANNLLMSLHKVSEDFVAKALPADSGHRLGLVPRDSELQGFVEELVLSVDDDLVLSGLEIVNTQGGTVKLTFQQTQLGPALPAGTFEFAVPEGFEVIDAG